MKRVNIQAAFIGEPTSSTEGLDSMDGDEAVMLLVRSGELTIVVPSGTPDAHIVQSASCLRGTLQLENERVLSFEINHGATGAFYEDEPAELHRQRAIQSAPDMFVASSPLFAQSAAVTTSVRTIMSSNPVTVSPEVTRHELAELLAFHHISGVPVVDDRGMLVGVVTETDVIGRPGRTVGELMTTEIVSVTEDAFIAQVATLMTDRRVRRLPVVRDGQIVGIVSQGDVVRWLATMGA